MDRCSVCNCELPRVKNGTVPRHVRRTHEQGWKHQRNSVALQRQREEALYDFSAFWAREEERRREEEAQARARLRAEAEQALRIGVLATRLRARHGDLASFRASCLREGEKRLAETSLPSDLKRALVGPAANALAARELKELAGAQFLLLSLLAAHCFGEEADG